MHTAMFKLDNQLHTGNIAQCYMAAWMGGEFGGEWIHVYPWLHLFAVHLNYQNIVNWLYPDTKLSVFVVVVVVII